MSWGIDLKAAFGNVDIYTLGFSSKLHFTSPLKFIYYFGFNWCESVNEDYFGIDWLLGFGYEILIVDWLFTPKIVFIPFSYYIDRDIDPNFTSPSIKFGFEFGKIF